MTSSTLAATKTKEESATGSKRGGKYLTFFLAGEEYGTEILKVQEIIGLMPITLLPGAPVYLRGVLNLRGTVIPVLDLRAKFGMEQATETRETCVIVLCSMGQRVGIVVDKVSEVVDIPEECVEDVPLFGINLNTDYIFGIGKSKGSIRFLLDIDRVLATPQLVDIHASLQEIPK